MNPFWSDLLQEISSDTLNISGDEIREARANTWGISLPGDFDTSSADVFEFLEAVRDCKRRDDSPLLFYAWFDELAGQLRLSWSSKTDIMSLSFRCPIDTSVTLSEIAQTFVENRRGRIELSELEEFTAGEDIKTTDSRAPLRVYVERV
ncbi:hypothetical protein [Rubinisphaera margarita]|uniref:hypothetical protein n=1 Tax=Rubinisphaera margarita TaxID=2909586 RepID=UPI001EE9A59D|nr:hypothetical protein [Rubinisphaera margarita]MCG6157164.1 hypothetical protein [Rubinisphaera margarita]